MAEKEIEKSFSFLPETPLPKIFLSRNADERPDGHLLSITHSR